MWNIIKTTWVNERWLRVNAGNQQMAQLIQLNGVTRDQFGQPAWLNRLGALDVEIVLDEGPDVANTMMDALDQLKTLPPGTVPPQVILKLLPLPQTLRNDLDQMFQQAQQKPDPKQQAAAAQAQTAQVKAQADIQKTQIQAQAEMANAQQDQNARILDAQRQADDHRNIMAQQAQEHQFNMAEIFAKNRSQMLGHAIRTQQTMQNAAMNRQQEPGPQQPRKRKRRRR
jgi:hypothetical protein